MKGVILCNRCRKKTEGVCSCGSYKCLVKIYHDGKVYEYRRDDQGYIFTYDKALDKLIDISKEIKKGTFKPEEFTDKKVEERKFRHQFQLWQQEKKEELDNDEISPEYYRHIESYQLNYYGFFDDYDVRDIDLGALSQFKLNHLRCKTGTTEPMRAKTRKNIMNVLHAFFSWSKKHGIIVSVPSFPEIKGASMRRQALTPNVQGVGLGNIPAEHRDAIQFMMNTGLRPGELVAALVKSYSPQDRVLWVERRRSGVLYREGTKNNEILPVPLNDVALSIVIRNVKGKFPNDFLFVNPNTKRPYTQWYLWDTWKRLSGTGVTLYEATRHSYCSQIVPLTDKLTAQRLMRHRDGRSTDNYYHASGDYLLDVVQKMGGNVVNIEEANSGK